MNAHIDDEQNESQINKLDPTDGTNCIDNNDLLVDWPCKLGTELDSYLNYYVSNNNQYSDANDDKLDNTIMSVPFDAMSLLIERKFEASDTCISFFGLKVFAKAVEVTTSTEDV